VSLEKILTQLLNSYGLVLRSLYELFEAPNVGSCVAVKVENLSDFIKKIFICFLKMKKSIMVLEQHEGD